MSTVLWANYLVDGSVTSDEADKHALFEFTDKLDSICDRAAVTEFSTILDSTDMRINLDQLELAEGMESTDELMARDGTWVDAEIALRMLETLLSTIRSEKIRFGRLKNAHDDVVAELEESIDFVNRAVGRSAKFNFSIVM